MPVNPNQFNPGQVRPPTEAAALALQAASNVAAERNAGTRLVLGALQQAVNNTQRTEALASQQEKQRELLRQQQAVRQALAKSRSTQVVRVGDATPLGRQIAGLTEAQALPEIQNAMGVNAQAASLIYQQLNQRQQVQVYDSQALAEGYMGLVDAGMDAAAAKQYIELVGQGGHAGLSGMMEAIGKQAEGAIESIVKANQPLAGRLHSEAMQVASEQRKVQADAQANQQLADGVSGIFQQMIGGSRPLAQYNGAGNPLLSAIGSALRAGQPTEAFYKGTNIAPGQRASLEQWLSQPANYALSISEADRQRAIVEGIRRGLSPSQAVAVVDSFGLETPQGARARAAEESDSVFSQLFKVAPSQYAGVADGFRDIATGQRDALIQSAAQQVATIGGVPQILGDVPEAVAKMVASGIANGPPGALNAVKGALADAKISQSAQGFVVEPGARRRDPIAIEAAAALQRWVNETPEGRQFAMSSLSPGFAGLPSNEQRAAAGLAGQMAPQQAPPAAAAPTPPSIEQQLGLTPWNP